MPTYTNSTLINGTILSPNYTSRSGRAIKKITIHHMAAVSSAEAVGKIFANKERQGSSNYGIGKDGEIYLYVPEQYRAWTSGSWDNDSQAVTIEVSNCKTGGDWPVSDKVYKKLIELCVDICKRNNIEKINFTGDTKGNLTMHKYYQNTCCPGPYLEAKFSEIAQLINEKLEEDKPMTTAEKQAFTNLQNEVKTLCNKIEQLSCKDGDLDERLLGLEGEVSPIYKTLKDCPDWSRTTIQKLINKGLLKGDGTGLNISYQQVRMFVILDRSGIFDR